MAPFRQADVRGSVPRKRLRHAREIRTRRKKHAFRALRETENGNVVRGEIRDTVRGRFKTQRVFSAAGVGAHRAVGANVGMGFFLVGNEFENGFQNDGRHHYVLGDEIDYFLPFHIQLPVLFAAAEYAFARNRGKTHFRHKPAVRAEIYVQPAAVFRKRKFDCVSASRKRQHVARGAVEHKRRALAALFFHLETAVR